MVVLHPRSTVLAAQGIPVAFGISETTAGARQLSLNLTAFAPGDSTAAHVHEEFEGGHRNTSHRIDVSFPMLYRALTAT